MARIRSALEIALERTEEIQIDPEKIRKDELAKKGKGLIGSFIHGIDLTADDLSSKLAEFNEKDIPYVKACMVDTLAANLILPSDELYVERLGKIKAAAEIIFSVPKETIQEMFIQIDGFFQQFLQDREQLTEMVTQQFLPKLRQKQEQLSRQYGQVVELRPEQDPEFMEYLDKNFKSLEAKYQAALNNLKEQFKTFL